MKKLLILLSFFLGFLQIGYTQDDEPRKANLNSPKSTIYNHLHFLQSDTYKPKLAAKSFHIKNDAKAKQLAIQLKQILDGKGLWMDLEAIPDNNNYRDSSLQKAIYAPFPYKYPEIYVIKIKRKWYYSPETAAYIPQLHAQIYPFGSDWLMNLSPQFGQTKVLGLKLWQYFGIALLLIITFVIHWFLTRLLRFLINKLAKSRINQEYAPPKLIWKIARLISLLLLIKLLSSLLPILHLHIHFSASIIKGFQILSTVFLMLLFLRIVDVFMLYFNKFTSKTSNTLDEQLSPILKKGLQILFIGWGIITILTLLNVNVTALIAGISIGGLALALAAQDTVKNLIGSIMIFIDRPFQIGDAIDFNGTAGTIEEVGFRSTRIRTFKNSLITIPNGILANATIDNYGARKFRHFRTTLGVTYDTSPEKIEAFIEGLRAIILKHPKTRKEGYYVHLNAFSASSLDIFFHLYFDVSTYNEDLEARQDVMLKIISLANALGVEFAFPSSTIYSPSTPQNNIDLKENLNNFIKKL